MNYHPLFLFTLLVFLSFDLSSQNIPDNEDRFSVEMGMGLHVPLLPSKQVDRIKYINFNHFQIASRYMVTHNFGVRVKYAYDRFQHLDDNAQGIIFNRIGIDGILNLRSIFNFLNNFDNIGILAHGGGSITFANVLKNNVKDRMINVSFGLMPMLKISENAALFADGSFVSTVKQNVNFNGTQLTDSDSGLYGTLSFGVLFYLGQNRTHADWD